MRGEVAQIFSKKLCVTGCDLNKDRTPTSLKASRDKKQSYVAGEKIKKKKCIFKFPNRIGKLVRLGLNDYSPYT